MPLSKKFIEEQKSKLTDEKDQLEKKIKKLKSYPDYGDLAEDNTQEMTDFENNKSLEDNLSATLKQVNKALKLIEKGSYGVCSTCKKNIEADRLEAMPYADRCTTCAKKSL